MQEHDVIIIGAGPSGTVAAANLARKGHDVLVLERDTFPRFSIGESLLPQCMVFLEEAGMLEAVRRHGFQVKNGAAFEYAGEKVFFDFSEKFTPGHSSTYEVMRAEFDALLADQAQSSGAGIRYGCDIKDVLISDTGAVLNFVNQDSQPERAASRFVLDASGFGRVLPNLLNLNRPSGFPKRMSLFTHLRDNISDPDFDREKILITVHPKQADVWLWLIPFSNGTSSIGVTGGEDFFDHHRENNEQSLFNIISDIPNLSRLLADAERIMEVRAISGYAASVTGLYGKNFALLGNAGEFLDPIFSSGITIALKSASLASGVLDRQLRGEHVDWEAEFAQPLSVGIETFRNFVLAWYDGRLQDIIFSLNPEPEFARMICSILAGYAWDEDNPYVQNPSRRLSLSAELCRQQERRA